jgi:hypothetical protein
MAGWFDFVNGQTLPASRVQDYLMDQSVMTFADAAARTAALPSPTNGMVTYLLSTGELYVRTSTAWVRVIDDNNTATIPPRRNVLINGSFEINQRNFTSTTANGTVGFDRWLLRANDATGTYSAQSFAPGDLEAAGGIARNYARIVTTGQTATNTLTILRQNVESVRTLAGKKVTLSFWARAGSGTPKVNMSITQTLGAGGSSNIETFALPKTITTSWARYSFTIDLPGLTGKTFGTTADFLLTNIFVSAGSDFTPAIGTGIQNNTFDFWGFQLEEGPVATPFVRAATTLQGELAACQRYYQRYTSVANNAIFTGTMFSSTIFYGAFVFPKMRVAPSSSVSAAAAFTIFGAGTSAVSTAAGLNTLSDVSAEVQISIGAPITAGSGAWARWAGTTGFYFFELSAEL